jgi:hypothetical protein
LKKLVVARPSTAWPCLSTSERSISSKARACTQQFLVTESHETPKRERDFIITQQTTHVSQDAVTVREDEDKIIVESRKADICNDKGKEQGC